GLPQPAHFSSIDESDGFAIGFCEFKERFGPGAAFWGTNHAFICPDGLNFAARNVAAPIEGFATPAFFKTIGAENKDIGRKKHRVCGDEYRK
ncbi:MAG TPA: hypothetical protein VKJ65_12270, partial [Phycisphaerae bacterium]|nr:hypothetical protein [Phycisphaerae bacterium]